MNPRILISAWGVLGVVVFLVSAIVRLLPRAVEVLPMLDGLQAGAYAASVVFMVYSEGYRGFQLRFSPRVVVRSEWVAHNPNPALVLLAPIMAMGLIHANRKRLMVAWGLLLAIVGLVALVSRLDTVWRGIVDAGVVAGLTWGVGTILWFWVQALRGHPPDVPVDLPEPAESRALTARDAGTSSP